MEEENFKILIEKKLNGTISTEEDKFLYQFEQTMLKKNKSLIFFDDNHRTQINKDLLLKINTKLKIKRKNKKRLALFSSAASVLLFITLGFTYTYYNNQTNIIFENLSNNPKKCTLSDGSTVTLNQNSKLIQDIKFNSENRFVELEGEAYFEIKKNKTIPFIIKTKTIYTKVVGTKFNINTNENYVNISVNEGHVQVYDNKDTLDATPNQQITYNFKNKKLIENTVKSDLFNLWTKDKFELNNITVEQLSTIFESVYNYKIVFKNEKIKYKKITITFERNEKINDVVDKINLINEFKLTKQQNQTIEAN